MYLTITLFEGVYFKLTSSWPPARERGVASCSPDAASAGSGGSGGLAGEFREAIFYAQARANRHICSELGVQFLKNPGKSPWAPQGTPKQPQGPPRDPQGIPKGPPRDTRGGPKGPMGPPRGARAAQREPSGPQIQAKGIPKPVHGQPKQAKRTNYINKLPINRLRGRYVII